MARLEQLLDADTADITRPASHKDVHHSPALCRRARFLAIRVHRTLWRAFWQVGLVANRQALGYAARVIALIDYGAGNLHSVEKALRYLGADVQRVTSPADLREAHSAVLPGVGAFDDCVHALNQQQLLD